MPSLWKKIIKTNLTKWNELADFLCLDETKRKQLLPKSPFPLKLPKRLAEKIEKNNLDDPILKQFLPIHKEEEKKEGFVLHPLQEQSFQQSPRFLKKYQKRALLLTSSACAMHCRYCFRRHFPYESSRLQYGKEIELIKKDKSISEIILSGGDPLSLDDKSLQELLNALEKINHLQLIRFHSRFPIGIPERIDDSLINLLHKCSKKIIFVIHCNHPDELDEDIVFSLQKLQEIGIPLLCQSVLLRGVNDNISILEKLSYALITHGVIPYYLHQLDPVEGGAHFHVDEKIGLDLIQKLKEVVPGYALFRYVKEIPGKPYKVEITSDLLS